MSAVPAPSVSSGLRLENEGDDVKMVFRGSSPIPADSGVNVRTASKPRSLVLWGFLGSCFDRFVSVTSLRSLLLIQKKKDRHGHVFQVECAVKIKIC